MMNNIPGIEEVNMIRDDGHVIHFNNPKVQASLAANTFAITGHASDEIGDGNSPTNYQPTGTRLLKTSLSGRTQRRRRSQWPPRHDRRRRRRCSRTRR